MIMASIALVDMDVAGLDAGELLHLRDEKAEGVAIVPIALQGFGVEHELAALGFGDRGCDADLAAELGRRPRLAFTDTLDVWGLPAVELPTALAQPLPADLIGAREREGKGLTSAASCSVLCWMSRLSRPSRVRRKRN